MYKMTEPGVICILAIGLLGMCAIWKPDSSQLIKEPVNYTVGGYFGWLTRGVVERKIRPTKKDE